MIELQREIPVYRLDLLLWLTVLLLGSDRAVASHLPYFYPMGKGLPLNEAAPFISFSYLKSQKGKLIAAAMVTIIEVRKANGGTKYGSFDHVLLPRGREFLRQCILIALTNLFLCIRAVSLSINDTVLF